jgi:hypothetical protein
MTARRRRIRLLSQTGRAGVSLAVVVSPSGGEGPEPIVSLGLRGLAATRRLSKLTRG